MLPLILVAVLAAYGAWAARRIYRRRKASKGKCADCPYKNTGLCG